MSENRRDNIHESALHSSLYPSMGLMKRLCPQIRVGKWTLRVALLLAFGLDLPLPVAAQHPPPPGTEAPTPQELNVWNAKIGRLQANTDSMPTGIADALASLTGVVTKSFECPDGSAVNSVMVNITTALVKWDDGLAVSGSAGTYNWSAVAVVTDGAKKITCQNWVMLDPAISVADEANPPLGPLADEGLAYHELLHAQLLIDEMDTDAWQAQACNCKFIDDASDGDHDLIHDLQDTYMSNRAPEVDVNVVRPEAQTADDEGNFDIDLGPAGKDVFTFEALAGSEGGNVDVSGINVTIENGRFHVHGTLLDPTMPGYFFIRIDPPVFWLFGGIEQALKVLPLEADCGDGICEPGETCAGCPEDCGPCGDIPTVSGWALIVMALLLLTAGTIVFGRRRRPAVA